MRVKAPQQAMACPRHHRRQSLPALEGQRPLMHRLATVGPFDGIQERGSVILSRAAYDDPHVLTHTSIPPVPVRQV